MLVANVDTHPYLQDYDFHAALGEVKPALGKQDDVLKRRYPYGIVESSATSRMQRELKRFVTPTTTGRLQSTLLVGAGAGAGVTALAAWAAVEASEGGTTDFTRMVTAVDLLGAGGDDARCAALVEKFAEAREMSTVGRVTTHSDTSK